MAHFEFAKMSHLSNFASALLPNDGRSAKFLDDQRQTAIIARLHMKAPVTHHGPGFFLLAGLGSQRCAPRAKMLVGLVSI